MNKPMLLSQKVTDKDTIETVYFADRKTIRVVSKMGTESLGELLYHGIVGQLEKQMLQKSYILR